MTKEERRELDRELITGVMGISAENVFRTYGSDFYWISIWRETEREAEPIRREFSPSERVQDAFECMDALDSICKERSLTLRFSLNNIKSALGAYHFIIKIIPDDLLLVGAYADDDGAIFAIGDAEERAEAIATACIEAYRAIKKEGE